MAILYELSEFEKNLARHFADLHNAKESKFGPMTYKGISGRYAHYIGLCGEIAVAQVLGSEIDLKTYSNGDLGFDLKFWGYNIDVKTTTYFIDPWLRVEIEHWKPETCYILCAFDGCNIIELVGRCTGQYIKDNGQRKRLVDNGPENYVIKGALLPKFKLKNFERCKAERATSVYLNKSQAH